MATRHANQRIARIHRNYTVQEIGALFGVHRNTVREWIKRGLPTTDCERPLLILGRGLAAFLQARRSKNKRPCQPGEIYCVRLARAWVARAEGRGRSLRPAPAVAAREAARLSLGPAAMVAETWAISSISHLSGSLQCWWPTADRVA